MKYASAFLVSAEIALYFALILMIPAFRPLFLSMLLFTGLVFVCLIFAEMLKKYLPLRILFLLIPAAALLLSPADLKLILFFPPFVYALLTAVMSRFNREHWRYVLIFKLFLVIGLVLALIDLIGDPDKDSMFYQSLILDGYFFLFGITGLRMIRSGAGGARWRLYNIAEIFLPTAAISAAVAGIVFLLSRVKDVFSVIAYPLLGLMLAVSHFAQWFFNLVMGEIEPQELAPISDDTIETIAEETEVMTTAEGSGEWFIPMPKPDIRWGIVLAVFFVLLTGVVMYIIFRRKAAEAEEDEIAGGRHYRIFRRKRNVGKVSTPAEAIRASYRDYLAMLSSRGAELIPADTSLDILRFASAGTAEEEEKLRELYIRARYGGEVSKEDAKEAARIVSELRAKR